MLEFIDTTDDALAVKVSHRITGTELDAILGRLEALFARHQKVHVFVETSAIDGIELSGLGNYTRRALPLIGMLSRFGRVAVVADQAWIRAATRLESALLPFISYRTFTPDRRSEALAWVAGEAA